MDSSDKEMVMIDVSKGTLDFYDAAWVWALVHVEEGKPCGLDKGDGLWRVICFYSEELAVEFAGTTSDPSSWETSQVEIGVFMRLCAEDGFGWIYHCKDGSTESFKAPRRA
jgi:hypothetical protein